MKKIFSIILLLSIMAAGLFAQAGPAVGSITSGWTTNTNSFSANAPENYHRLKMFNKVVDINEPTKVEQTDPSIIFPDNQFTKSVTDTRDSVILHNTWRGIDQTNSIPPDPYIAVGPNHIVEVVNTSFRITDKKGNVSATISAGSWYGSNGKSYDPFDPKVIYDHHKNRWVQVWLHADDASQESFYLVSVSDDEDPNGIWYNYAMPADLNGEDYSGGWSDYQGVGYDDKAVYITANQFTYDVGGSGNSYQYSKLRIIPTDQLYRDDSGEVQWMDFWNLNHFGLRPCRMNSTSDKFYMVRSSQSGGSFMYVFTVSDPVGSPSISYSPVAVASYSSPSNASQLGGNALESGGANVRTEPVYQDGVIHIAHSVRDGNFSAVRYVAIEPQSTNVIKDMALSSGSHYYTYPAIAVAANGDVVISYSRSSNNEYMGAYFTVVKPHMNEALGSFELQTGNANYYKTFGGSRNRWGDYMGAWTDPADPNNVWIYAEYAYSENTWGNYVGLVRTIPFEERTISLSTESLDFREVEVGETSESKFVVIKNYGAQDLEVTNISNENSDVEQLTQISLPVTLAAYDSLVLEYQFNPTSSAVVEDAITITSNDANAPSSTISVSARGFSIDAVTDGLFYGYSANLKELITLNAETAEAQLIGAGELNNLHSMSLNPANHILYALMSEGDATSIVRINATAGDSYKSFSTNFLFTAATFDTTGLLWTVTDEMKLVTVDLESEGLFLHGTLSKGVNAMAYNPVDGMLYASISADSTDNDKLLMINPTDASLTDLGSTGTGKSINALVFDKEGNLYGTVDKAFARSYLNTFDLVTAKATEIGMINDFKSISGLAIAGTLTGVEEIISETPDEFKISQNYPNPFNPTTNINFALPYSANVKLVIYNSLGETVETLVNETMDAGTYTYKWNAENLSTGVYIYQINVEGTNGQRITESGKMMFLK